jgi:uncharacterized protein
MPNHLITSGSPYLQQHAHNPVEWYPWSDKAFIRAVQEDKPLIISIGYSTCHWCHVMERESFEDQDVADFMNEHFVCIKVDREEHPEIDQLYMDACQLISGQGGWPLNCFALPDKRPFFAGTYYPPTPMYKRPSWMQVLHQMLDFWKNKRAMVISQAERLKEMIEKGDHRLLGNPLKVATDFSHLFDKNIVLESSRILQSNFDYEDGGFSGAPKFPMFQSLNYIYETAYYLKNVTLEEFVFMSVQKMIRGGIFDQIGGGICRYSTDEKWLVPHFEKMLYDQAGLIAILSSIYKKTANDEIRSAAEITLSYLEREMKSPDGLYYSALDADSEGVEGKFYIWDKAEFDLCIGDDSGIMADYFQVLEHGNWEGTNILHRNIDEATFAKKREIDPTEFRLKLDKAKEKLMKSRSTRIRPGLDHKIVLTWNLLLTQSILSWAEAVKSSDLEQEGIKLFKMLESTFLVDGKKLLRVKINNEVKHLGNLDDYAYFIKTSLMIYASTKNKYYLTLAEQQTEICILSFYNEESGLFYYTEIGNKEVFARKEEIFDNTLPSGNAIMFQVLIDLYRMTQFSDYEKIYMKMAARILPAFQKFPSSFSCWGSGLLKLIYTYYSIKSINEHSDELIKEIKALFLPNCMINPNIDNLITIPNSHNIGVMICTDNMCLEPATTIENFKNRIEIS